MEQAFTKEDVMNEWSNAKLCDVANLILGAVLLASPWMFAFATGPETQNAVGSGAVIVILSIAALAAFAFWEEWLNRRPVGSRISLGARIRGNGHDRACDHRHFGCRPGRGRNLDDASEPADPVGILAVKQPPAGAGIPSCSAGERIAALMPARWEPLR
jgi:hypothetical protein